MVSSQRRAAPPRPPGGHDEAGGRALRDRAQRWLAAPLDDPRLRALAWTTIVFSLAIGAIEPTVYALVDGLHRPAEFGGVLVSVQGGGAILGGIGVSAAIRRVAEQRLVVIGLSLVAAGIGLCAMPAVPAALAGFVLIGAGLPTLTVAAATQLQRSTPNPVMGRVAASYDMLGTVPTTASIAVEAVLVGIWPYPTILGISAVGCSAASVMLILMSRASGRTAPTPSAPTGQATAADQTSTSAAPPAADRQVAAKS